MANCELSVTEPGTLTALLPVVTVLPDTLRLASIWKFWLTWRTIAFISFVLVIGAIPFDII
jgi:hypothetical protein